MSLVFFLMITPSIAQQSNQQAPAEQPAEQPAEVSDQELQMASKAYVEVLDISGKFQQDLQNAQNPEERTQLQKQANDNMIKAVEKSGLKLERYNEIMTQVRADEELAKEFNDLVKDK